MTILNTIKTYGREYIDSLKVYERESSETATDADVKRQYVKKNSFTNLLPYFEFLPEEECFLLDDEKSVAAVCDIYPANSEGVRLDELAKIRDNFQSFLIDTFPQEDKNPWVVEVYQSDILSLSHFSSTIKNYVKSRNANNPVTDEYMPVMEKHLKDVCKEGGLFLDDTVTGEQWRGSIRVYRLVYYRKYTGKNMPSKGRTPIEELHEQRQKLESQLNQYGIGTSRVGGRAFFDWMVRWLNPKPSLTNGDVDKLIEMFDYQDDDLPYGHDLAESMMVTPPSSDREKGIWYFDGMPHKSISVMNLRKAPKIGALSAPKKNGKHISSLFDRMPEGTVMSMKVVIKPVDTVDEEIERIRNKVQGDGAKQERARDEADTARSKIANNDPMFPCEVVFYVRGENEVELKKNSVDVISILQTQGLNAIDDEKDPVILDSYIRNLPMNYDFEKDSFRRRSRLMFSQHIANLMPIFGRGRGTGNPGIVFFNRGGEPMCFDPLNPDDRAKNAHLLLFGPTGSGKSAQIVGILLYLIAVYNVRIFLVEAGNSFGLLREYLQRTGISTHKVAMSHNGGTLPPFANALKALELEEKGMSCPKRDVDVLEEVWEEFESNKSAFLDDEEEDEKDYLGEMEIVARIIVSGGNKSESDKIRLGDQQIIRECILDAARLVRKKNIEMVLPEHVAAELLKVSQDQNVPQETRTRFFDYAAAMRLFTQGLAGSIFNRPGELWPDVDFTHVDLKAFTRDNKKAELAVSYMSLLNHVNDIAEREQFGDRETIFLTDESHLITTNALLAPGVVKIAKMWRKLGCWLWMATQNMKDFPDESAVMLSLFEWWLCLNLESAEVKEVSRFKDLTKEQAHLLASTRKQNGAYTEGVVMSSKLTELFRAVPPSRTLVYAWSERHEKAKLKQCMQENDVDVLSAADIKSWEIDRARGIAN
ncbi:conjugative transfer ATPase [Vibrio rotiferianus]|uniref:conjugative transfer ATPase n=1 Tax=Vibrio rotiferianus TaxID=190895 RepID=UPI000694D997|nr:conjugative transfer ATPase [Vibrio rotiferianus]